jgi:hypothetical protein
MNSGMREIALTIFPEHGRHVDTEIGSREVAGLRSHTTKEVDQLA